MFHPGSGAAVGGRIWPPAARGTADPSKGLEVVPN